MKRPSWIQLRPSVLTSAELWLYHEVTAFLRTELPRGSFRPGLGMNAASDREFSRKLGARGWLGMALPQAYGGHERPTVERFIVAEQLLRWGAPIGHHWVADRQSGPVIARYGTEEQKRLFLPRICRGEIGFCVGMSEADSGSDLASLSTRATRCDAGWLLSGCKSWTTGAHLLDYCIVLCRTTPRDDVDDRRHGMTQLIVNLTLPGIRITPIPFIDGTADFCEVMFDDVVVPDDMVLGEVGRGWSQNTSELAYERGGPDRWLSSYLLIEELLRQELTFGVGSNELVNLLGGVIAEYWNLHQLSLSLARMIDDGVVPMIESSLLKEMGTRFEQDVVHSVLAYLREAPTTADDSSFGRLVMTAALTQPSFTIRGGTNEILRSLVAKGLRPHEGGR